MAVAIEEKRITELPLNGRNAATLKALSLRLLTQSGQTAPQVALFLSSSPWRGQAFFLENKHEANRSRLMPIMRARELILTPFARR